MKVISMVLKGFVQVYRYGISPILPGSCRFTPTCSAYALQAIDRFGPFKGGWMAIKRLLRCNPWGGCGHDPVPERDLDDKSRDDKSGRH